MVEFSKPRFICIMLSGLVLMAVFMIEFCHASTQCRPGYIQRTNISSLICVPCPAGTYYVVIGDAPNCTSCPPGSLSLPASASIDACTCNAGYTSVTSSTAGRNCTACRPGKYKAQVGQSECVQCPPDSDSDTGASECNCNGGFRPGSPVPMKYSAGLNCDYPNCNFEQIFTTYTGFFCNFQYPNFQNTWWIIAPDHPYSGIVLTFLEFETEFQSDVATVYFCLNISCCNMSPDAPPPSCMTRTPIARSGRIRYNQNVPADACGRRPLSESFSNPIRSLSPFTVLKVVFRSDFSVKLRGFAAKWESIESTCVACSTGKYKEGPGNTPCEPCQAGKYAARAATTACLPCPDASTSLNGSATCSCEAGSTTTYPVPMPPYSACPENTRSSVWLNSSSGSICYVFGAEYPPFQKLWWIIVSPHPNTPLRLAFSDSSYTNWSFNTEVVFDYVTVYECSDDACGPTTRRKLLRHSGPVAPDPVWAMTGFVRVEFVSDVSTGAVGFTLSWQIHPDIDGGAAESCAPCGPGKYKEVGGPSECIPCPAGSFSGAPGATACEACGANNTYTLPGQATECVCNAGYSPLPQLGADSESKPGGIPALVCSACPAGTYKPTIGSGTCIPCPSSSQSQNGSVYCACNIGFQSLPPPNSPSLISTPSPFVDSDGNPFAPQRFCKDAALGLDGRARSTSPSGILCRLKPLANELRRWVVAPAVPNAGVVLRFTNWFDLSDNLTFVRGWACNDAECACQEDGRCVALLNPTTGSAAPDEVIASTGMLMLEFCTNCTKRDSDGQLIFSPKQPVADPIFLGDGFIGYYTSIVGDNCAFCQPGSYSAELGPAACPLCPDGNFSASSGATFCQVCPPSYTSIYDEGSTGCRCAVGYALNNKTKACAACPAGTYSPSRLCIRCGPNSYSEEHAELCLCNAGYEWSAPLISSDPVPPNAVCKSGAEILRTSSGRICLRKYRNNEDLSWVIQPSEPNNGMVLTFTLLDVEPGYDSVSIYSCKDASCFRWNKTFMTSLASQNSTKDPIVSILFKEQDSWFASENAELPLPIAIPDKVVKVFFKSDASNTLEGFSLFWEKQYGRNCSACQVGTFKAIAGTSLCIPCPAGTYSDMLNTTSCKSCPPNFFSEMESSQSEENCRRCPGGSFSRAGASKKGECSCFPGDYLDPVTDACLSCPPGKYKSSSGNSPCLSCPPNSFSAAGSGDITSCQCNAGYAGNVSNNFVVCSICPANFYKDVAGQSGCFPCSLGSYSYTGATATSDCICSAGYTPSPRNFSSPPTYSQDCPETGRILQTMSGTVCDLNYGSEEYKWWILAPLKGGAFSPSPILLTFTSFDTEFKLDYLEVFSCQDSGCFAPKGLVVHSGNTLPSPIYSSTGALKLVFRSDESIELTGWSAFWQTEGIGCIPCPAGSFKSVQGLSECIDCPVGTYTPEKIAATECSLCPSNSWSPAKSVGLDSCKCNPGYYAENDTRCSVCPKGSYKRAKGSTACIGCGLGSYSTTEGATSPIYCLSCTLNSYTKMVGSVSCECNAGYSGDGFSCYACLEGTFKNTTGPSGCERCRSGTYSPSRGSSSCLLCEAGKYSTAIASVSEKSCFPCLLNSFSGAGSQSFLSCQCNQGFVRTYTASCSVCPAGTYTSSMNATVCSKCNSGKYSSSLAGKSEAICIQCMDNATSSAGSISIVNCSCNPGHSPGMLGCLPCARGKYKSAAGNYACLNCKTGESTNNVASVSDTECNSCSMGTFWDSSSQCIECPAGKYSRQTSLFFEESCQLCPAGMFNNMTGTTTCLLCSGTTFTSMLGATTCANCPEYSDSIQSMGAQCDCRFPAKGIILNIGDMCTKYFEDSIVWILGVAGQSCFDTCLNSNMTCRGKVSTDIDTMEKLLYVANITSTQCHFTTGSGSHLAPHRFPPTASCYFRSTASFSCYAQDPFFQRFCSCMPR